MTPLTFFILVTIGAVVIFNLGYQVGLLSKAEAPRAEPERKQKSYELKAEKYFN